MLQRSSGINGRIAASQAFVQDKCCSRRTSMIARQNPNDKSDPIPHNTEKMLFGEDFLARDAYDYEKEYAFGSKPLGNANTEHIVKIPDGYKKIIGLAARSISDQGSNEKLPEEEVYRLRHQTTGWRIDGEDGDLPGWKLRQTWTLKDYSSALELAYRIGLWVQREQYFPQIHIQQGGSGTQLTATLGEDGLCLNDFIMASKLNMLSTRGLTPERKQKYWA